MSGSLVLIWGPVMANKTAYMLRRAEAMEAPQFFIPAVAGVKYLNHRDGLVPATPLKRASELCLYQAKNICLDKVHLFKYDPTVVPTLTMLRDAGANIICTGLDLSSEQEPFGVVPEIAAHADTVKKLRGRCHDCYCTNGIASYYTGKDKVSIVHVGGDYICLCRKCLALRRGQENWEDETWEYPAMF